MQKDAKFPPLFTSTEAGVRQENRDDTMTEVLFILTAIMVAYIVYGLISSKKRSIERHNNDLNKAPLRKKAEQPLQSKPKITITSKGETSVNDKFTIFLSYRRQDSADVSGRLYDRLTIQYGIEKVFKDVDSIPLGEDFREYIDLMVAMATVFLVVIGPKWKGNKDGDAYKIDDPRDFVRLEVASALKRKIPVIPLLVANAKIPSEHDLPKDIRSLAFRNGIPLRPDPDFNNDIERLLSGLSKLSNKSIKLTQNPLLL